MSLNFFGIHTLRLSNCPELRKQVPHGRDAKSKFSANVCRIGSGSAAETGDRDQVREKRSPLPFDSRLQQGGHGQEARDRDGQKEPLLQLAAWRANDAMMLPAQTQTHGWLSKSWSLFGSLV